MQSKQIIYVCSTCGEEYLRWQGRCDNCSEWNTLKEFQSIKSKNQNYQGRQTEAISIGKIKISNFKRLSSKINEFDRVLGGGIVPGSIMILGGDPGIGKSTLLLQLTGKLPNILYVSGEESVEQLKMRFERLGLKTKDLKVLSEINLNVILSEVEKQKPNLIIIDSIQAVYSDDFPSTPGSIVQVRECALRFQQLAKASRIPIILVGHVTKEGSVAGPKTLEHLVDVVLYLEGERYHNHRILRSVKNRYGATDEVGIFEMGDTGMVEITNPSKLFLAERLSKVPGTVVTSALEGSRALLVEVQALVSTTIFGYPQRRAAGFDLNRLELLVAVLQKRADINLANQDVFINIVGGINIKEPAVDLAVAIAIVSGSKGKPIDSRLCVFGEIGLAGEIRQVSRAQKRETEARRLGFSKFVRSKTLKEAVRSYCV